MILAGRPAKILLIDTNVYFSKRLSDGLKREGFDVTSSTQPAFALTTLEYDPPTAIVCSTNMREMGALDIARMIRADVKNSAMPIIALGDGSQRALMEAFQAGCDDYIDRSRPPAVIASHIRNIIVSKAEGFQPTQMLPQADTSLSGSLTHHDLPSVIQMLGQAHQTGALHINSGNTDALLFFDAGNVSHAECGSLFGDEAVIHILKSCFENNSGVYKFAYGSSSPQRTVLRSSTDLMLDAMREVDESAHESEAFSESRPFAEDIVIPQNVANDSIDSVKPAKDSTDLFSIESSVPAMTTDEMTIDESSLLPERVVECEPQQTQPSELAFENYGPVDSENNTHFFSTPSVQHEASEDPGELSAEIVDPAEPETDSSEFSDSDEFTLEQLSGGFNYPPSEGYFFADRKAPQPAPTTEPRQADESTAETETSADSGDFAAISDAIDRFAFRHSNDFSAAAQDQDFGASRLEHPKKESSASPVAPHPAVQAADDSSVATPSEEEL